MDLFENRTTAERLETLLATFPDGITYDNHVVTFKGKSVVLTSCHRVRLNYKKWAQPAVTRIPLSQVKLIDNGETATFIFSDSYSYAFKA